MKNRNGPGERFGPVGEVARGPTGGSQTGTLFSPTPSLTARTHPSARLVFNLRPKITPGDHAVTAPSILINARPFHPQATPISTPRAPLSSPFDLSRKPPPNQRRFLVGIRSFRRRLRSLSTKSVSPAPSLLSYPLCLALTHPPNPLSWFESPQIDTSDAWPKHTTAPTSSRSSTSPQEEIGVADQEFELAVLCYMSSTFSSMSQPTGTSPLTSSSTASPEKMAGTLT
jgi:hypothetical protein